MIPKHSSKRLLRRPIAAVAFFFMSAVLCVSAVVSFAGETVETVVEGLTCRIVVREDVPWAIQTLEMRRNTPGLGIDVALGGEYVLGLEPLDSIIGRVSAPGRTPVGAVNGDFYILQAGPYQGDPVGLCVVEGELLSTPIRRSALVFMADGSPSIGRFAFKGEIAAPDGSVHRIRGVNQRCANNAVVLLTPRFNDATRPEEGSVVVLAGPFEKRLSPAESFRVSVIEKRAGTAAVAIPPHRIALVGRGSGARFLERLAQGDEINVSVAVEPGYGAIVNAVGGGPRLMRGGAVSIEAKAEGIAQSFVDTRHPRTAFGWNADSCFLVTVDGRQEGYSAGMSLPELAAFMKELGAVEAINLDGGGSTTMWVKGVVRNRPSDKRLRPLANGIVVFEGKRP